MAADQLCDMRLFIAVEINENVRKEAIEVMEKIRALDADIKFTEPDNLHLTLKFLGEVPEERVKEVENVIIGAVKDFKAFRISIEGLGYFGKPNYIRTLWLDIYKGREELMKLARNINTALDYIRHETREPKPHLTIGRVKSGRNKEALLKEIESLKHVKLGEMGVKFVKLKQSILTKERPHYADLKAFELT